MFMQMHKKNVLKAIVKGSAKYFLERAESEYFRLRRPSVCHDYLSSLPSEHEGGHVQHVNEQAWACSSKILFTETKF